MNHGPHDICRSCETVEHCISAGCIPLTTPSGAKACSMNPDSLPSEMVLVPREPTPKMIAAAIASWGKANHGSAAAYRAMIEAAPAAHPSAAPQGAQPVQRPKLWHDLKTDPDVFDAVAEGRKTFEIRLNDRNFKVGDGLLLRKTRDTGWAMNNTGAPLEYTGEELRRVISHVLVGPVYGLVDGWAILSFAAASSADAAPVPQEVRMLTDDEAAPILDDIIGNYPSDLAERIVRKAFEVNAGRTIPAKEQTNG